MPYIITSPTLCQAFPHNCPYCGTTPASTTVRQPYSKMSLSKLPGHVRSQNWKIELPSCGDCAKWFSFSRLALFVLGFSALLFPILVFAIDSAAVPVLWSLSVAGWLVLLLCRRYRVQALRIAYMGEGEVVYATRSESYASDFASKNNLSYEHRAVVIRFA